MHLVHVLNSRIVRMSVSNLQPSLSETAGSVPAPDGDRVESRLRIAVVIPTFNEADRIADVIAQTRELGPCQILVVDGDSDDGTLQEARATGADCCLTAVRGRAAQQNAGAAAGSGDILLFLHADCRLEAGSFEAIREAMSDPNCVGGCFQQRIEANGLRYRLLEWGNAQRVKWWTWAYGDQGIFVRRSVFEQLGGFPDLRLMEDLCLMKRLKKHGRFALLENRIHISARRWKRQGVFRQTLRNWAFTALVQCGVSPDRLAKHYPHVR